MRSKTKCVSFRVDEWLDDLIILKAKNKAMSKSSLLRSIIIESLTEPLYKNAEKIVYYNDPKGILRSRKL